MSSPQQYVDRLTALAESARHHPQPAVAVALLAQLLLDVVTELQPIAQKYSLVLRAAGPIGMLEELERSLSVAELELETSALPADQVGGFDPAQDTTGTAG